MNKKQRLIEYYSNFILSLDCIIDDNGFISFRPNPAYPPEPITILGGKRLAIPTDFVMQHLYEGNIVPFHPLSEVIVMGQSTVIQTTRQIVNASLTQKILSTMLGICTGISKQVTMTAKQTDFVKNLEKVDEKTVKALIKLIDVIDSESPNRLINVFLKHGGILHDVQYKRICTVNFPLYQELLEAEDTVYGVKMRKQDVRILRTLLETIFPNIDTPNYYSYGTDTLVCPYFIALLGGFKNVVTELNRVSYKFKKIIEEYTGTIPHVNVDFIDEIGDGTIFKDIIPPLDYNRGTDKGQKEDTGNAQAPQPVQQVQAQPQPVQVMQQPMAQPVQVMQPMQIAQPYQAPVQVVAPVKQNPYSGIVKNKLGSNADLSNAKVSSSNSNSNNGTITNQSDFLAAAYPAAVYGQPMPMMPQPMAMNAYGQVVPVAQPMQMMPQQVAQPVQMMPQQVVQQPQMVMNAYGQSMVMPGQPMMGMGQPMMQPGGYQPGSAYPKF